MMMKSAISTVETQQGCHLRLTKKLMLDIVDASAGEAPAPFAAACACLMQSQIKMLRLLLAFPVLLKLFRLQAADEAPAEDAAGMRLRLRLHPSRRGTCS